MLKLMRAAPTGDLVPVQPALGLCWGAAPRWSPAQVPAWQAEMPGDPGAPSSWTCASPKGRRCSLGLAKGETMGEWLVEGLLGLDCGGAGAGPAPGFVTAPPVLGRVEVLPRKLAMTWSRQRGAEGAAKGGAMARPAASTALYLRDCGEASAAVGVTCSRRDRTVGHEAIVMAGERWRAAEMLLQLVSEPLGEAWTGGRAGRVGRRLGDVGGLRVMLSRCGVAAAGARPLPGASQSMLLGARVGPAQTREPASMVKQV